MQVGDEIIIISWLHRAQRNVMEGHPRGDASRQLTGVFSTRSADGPNPMGFHRVKVFGMDDGTPVIDIKPVVETSDY